MSYEDFYMVARMLEAPDLYSKDEINDAVRLLRDEAKESLMRKRMKEVAA